MASASLHVGRPEAGETAEPERGDEVIADGLFPCPQRRGAEIGAAREPGRQHRAHRQPIIRERVAPHHAAHHPGPETIRLLARRCGAAAADRPSVGPPADRDLGDPVEPTGWIGIVVDRSLAVAPHLLVPHMADGTPRSQRPRDLRTGNGRSGPSGHGRCRPRGRLAGSASATCAARRRPRPGSREPRVPHQLKCRLPMLLAA